MTYKDPVSGESVKANIPYDSRGLPVFDDVSKNELAGYLKEGKNVNVKIEVGYPDGGGVRSSEFRVIPVINGIAQRPKIFNQ